MLKKCFSFTLAMSMMLSFFTLSKVDENFFRVLEVTQAYASQEHSTAISSSNSFSVQESVANALSHSPLLQSKFASRQSAENQVRQAKAGYYPTIGLWAGVGASQDTSYDTRKSGIYDDAVGLAEIGLNARWTLWDAGLTSSTVKSREASHIASFYDVIDSASTIAFSALSAHADILRYQEIVALTEKYIKEHKSILSILYVRYDKGLSTKGELDQVLGRLHQAEATLLSYEDALYNAQLSYERLTGAISPKKLATLENPEQVYTHYDEVQHISFSKNYYLRALLSIVESLENMEKSIKAGLAPKVFLSTGPSYATKDTSADRDIFAWSAMLNLEWTLFDGGATRASMRASADDVVAAKKNYSEAKDKLNEEIKRTLKRVEVAHKQAVLYAQADKKNQLARNNFFLQFEAGKKDLLSILDAETASFSASVSHVVALTDSILGQYKLHALAGTLLTSLGINEEVIGNTVLKGRHTP